MPVSTPRGLIALKFWAIPIFRRPRVACDRNVRTFGCCGMRIARVHLQNVLMIHVGTDRALSWRASASCLLAGLVSLFGSVACTDSTVATPATDTPRFEPSITAGVDASIELTDKGFAPDRIEVRQGTRVMLRNSTHSKLSIVLKGRESDGDGESITLEAGQSIQLGVQQVGAYVLTLADDPQANASILIS